MLVTRYLRNCCQEKVMCVELETPWVTPCSEAAGVGFVHCV